MESISVSVRVRPLSHSERAEGGSPWAVRDKRIILQEPSLGVPCDFAFDNVFDEKATTQEIFQTRAVEIARSVVGGFNGTIFAYGQTSSGKTHTMRGDAGSAGIIPLCIDEIFAAAGQATDREFLLRVSYLEIYNEEINDLLCPTNRKLQIHENAERGIFVAGLREEIVLSAEQVLQLLQTGEANRAIGETKMNQRSSRSHTIFRMVVESRELPEDDEDPEENCEAVRVATLNLVDLAGSERVSKTGAEGQRLREGGHINKSLMTLGTVINKLSEGLDRNGGHIPFRDSKLTRILQPALGGNTKTAIICCITPARRHEDESLGTLRFAQRAKKITNCVTVNEILDDKALLKRQRNEIEELRQQLEGSNNPHRSEEILKLRNALLQMESEKDLMAAELEESRQVQEESLKRMQAQERKIERMKSLMLSTATQQPVQKQAHGVNKDDKGRVKKVNRRETWCPPRGAQGLGMLAGDLSPGQERSAGEAARWLSATLEEEGEEDDEEQAGEGRDELRARAASDAQARGGPSAGETDEVGSARESGAAQGVAGLLLDSESSGYVSQRPRSMGDASSGPTLKELQEQVEILQAERDQLKQDLTAAEERQAEQDSDLSMLQAEVENLEARLDDAAEEQEKLHLVREEERLQWQREKSALEVQLEEGKQNIEAAEEQLVDFESELRAVKAERDALLADKATSPQDLALEAAKAAARARLAELVSLLGKWKEQSGRTTGPAASTTTTSNNACTDASAVEVLREVLALNQSLQEQLASAEERHRTEAGAHASEAGAWGQELREVKEAKGYLERELRGAEKALAKLREELATAAIASAAKEQSLREQLAAAFKESEASAAEAQKALQAAGEARYQAEQAAQEAARGCDEAQKSAAELMQAKGVLSRQVEELQLALEESQREAADIMAQKAGLERRLELMAKDSEQLKTQASQCQHKLEEATRAAADEVADMRKELATLRKQAASASSRPAALEKEKEALRRDVEKRKAKMQDLEAKLKSTLQDKVALQADIASLEKEVKLLRGQSNLLSREVSKKESTTEKQKGAAAEKERLLAEKLEEVQEQAQAIQALQAQLESAEERCTTLEAQLSECAEELQASQHQTVSMEGHIAQLKHNLEYLAAQKEQLEAQLAQSQLALQEDSTRHAQEQQRLGADLEEASRQFMDETLQHEQEKASWEASKKFLEGSLAKLKLELDESKDKLRAAEEGARLIADGALKEVTEQLQAKTLALAAAEQQKRAAEEAGKAAHEKVEKLERRMRSLQEDAAEGRARGERDSEQLRVLADEVRSLHAKLNDARTAAQTAEQQRQRAEDGARLSREEVARLQERLQSVTAELDAQAEAGAAMEEQLRLSNARISELEAQVAGLDHAASPFTGRSPLLRSASKGLEATLRKRIETLEMELQSVGLMRSQEQEIWKSFTVDRKRKIDGLTARLKCSEEQREQLERVVKATQRQKQRDSEAAGIGAETEEAAALVKERAFVQELLAVQEKNRKAAYNLDRLYKKHVCLKNKYETLLEQTYKDQGQPRLSQAGQPLQERMSPSVSSDSASRPQPTADGIKALSRKASLLDQLSDKENMMALENLSAD